MDKKQLRFTYSRHLSEISCMSTKMLYVIRFELFTVLYGNIDGYLVDRPDFVVHLTSKFDLCTGTGCGAFFSP